MLSEEHLTLVFWYIGWITNISKVDFDTQEKLLKPYIFYLNETWSDNEINNLTEFPKTENNYVICSYAIKEELRPRARLAIFIRNNNTIEIKIIEKSYLWIVIEAFTSHSKYISILFYQKPSLNNKICINILATYLITFQKLTIATKFLSFRILIHI